MCLATSQILLSAWTFSSLPLILFLPHLRPFLPFGH
jgi:hypothetical protein